MPLSQGSVSVAPNGVAVKSGAAGRLYDILLATANASIAGGVPSGNAGYKIKAGIAAQANDFAEWMVDEITTNARASVGPLAIGVNVDPISHAGAGPPPPNPVLLPII